MLLTNRKLPERDTVRDSEDIVPHFALPTTSNVIRSQRAPEIKHIIKERRKSSVYGDRQMAEAGKAMPNNALEAAQQIHEIVVRQPT
eukprot:jgi/Hompol1/6277/HPOL_002521-RA